MPTLIASALTVSRDQRDELSTVDSDTVGRRRTRFASEGLDVVEVIGQGCGRKSLLPTGKMARRSG